MSVIIGLGHYSRTGKDTTADALVSALRSRGVRAVKRSFASDLKSICHLLYGHLGLHDQAFYDIPENAHLRDVPLPKIHKTPVQIWVEVGMHMRSVYAQTWIDKTLDDNDAVEVIVAADTRFFNEVYGIKDRGGTVVKVVRPGIVPRATPADQELVDFTGWDEIIGSSGQILELISWAEAKAIEIHQKLRAYESE